MIQEYSEEGSLGHNCCDGVLNFVWNQVCIFWRNQNNVLGNNEGLFCFHLCSDGYLQEPIILSEQFPYIPNRSDLQIMFTYWSILRHISEYFSAKMEALPALPLCSSEV